MPSIHIKTLAISLAVLPSVQCQSTDTLGLDNGYINLNTANFNAKIVRSAQVLASLTPVESSFDFLPFDYLPLRAHNGQYHWGDITFRYREIGTINWTDGNSASAREPVISINSSSTLVLSASQLTPTLPTGPLNVTREWIDVSGDLGLQFTFQNTGSDALEIGSLGFPAEFNSIFTGRAAARMQALCSLSDPYIGMHAGYIRVTPTSGTGAALVVTPLNGTNTPLEAYRNLEEPYYDDTAYGSQTFEGFYEWQVLSKSWAETEWEGVEPWNEPSALTLEPGEVVKFGVRFSVAKEGVRGIDDTIRDTGTPVARAVPGYIIPRGVPARLFLSASAKVESIVVEPAAALMVEEYAAGSGYTVYTVTPSETAWGRVRLMVLYADEKIQAMHYFVTKPGTEAVGDLGGFLTTEQWFEDISDPFGRAPSVMTYDYEERAIVRQDARAWVAGLSDEAGAGSFLAATMKQAVQPNADEVAKLETFVNAVLFKTIQTEEFSVRKSIFFYEPAAMPNYTYSSDIDWTAWWSWNKDASYATDRAYDYVHVAAAYWALYRVGRAYPDLLSSHTWDWYLDQAYSTVVRAMESDVGYNRVGLMGETVFGEILADLTRESETDKAQTFTELMRSRAEQWDSEEIPYGSEMAWDSTGQEGVYYWTKYFGFTDSAAKTVNSVLGYMPTVPHWGWNGNARRYWDNIYGGKLERIERQIHHYGSGLNALILLSAFRSNPTDTYLLRAGYGGTSGPLSSINADGFAAASFHSFPDTLKWDGYSGDYGPNFVGLALGSGTYVVQEEELGIVAYGGVVEVDGAIVKVTTTDPVRRRVFIGTLGVAIEVDAGIIQEFRYGGDGGSIAVTLSNLDGVTKAEAAVIWIEITSGSVNYIVSTEGIVSERGGWRVPLSADSVVVELQSAS
ncbi:uncharacterized protein BCR38DRAFT_521188 [Pseudomassariella vexata]|uniref:Glycoside hydrolase family 43 protein n=1 Tax=Pseudomassariella vexata TaxID=1141098 RepID=A0A1Y2EFP1_9PEZI|nr:uncharacterized protein BCR38DRAFT_521188 [Pseudomassariella vexata]ORY70398.1 hypothetical protein BCR38DRAFT_521188 [Pseudomassariella vexata]